jgi:glycosyltransferase involved in cell wall biosynthesis
MPTRGRVALAVRAAEYFLAQDYPKRELVIVEQGSSGLRDLLPRTAAIRVVTADNPHDSIGTLRNAGCGLARGDVFAHWDDDDWYGPERISRQITPILNEQADITAVRHAPMLDLESWTFWRCSPALHRRMFQFDVHGGTLVYRRHLWDRLARYPDSSLAEDAAFLGQAIRQGARLRPVNGDGIFIYVRHGANSWSFRCGVFIDPAGWRREAEPPSLPETDRSFYKARSRFTKSAPAPRSHGARHITPFGDRVTPLVSCIMPTRDRRPFVAQAIEYFLRQEYPAKELVIIDDGADPITDLVPDIPSITYRRLDRPKSIGEKRNLACALASGVVIAHWDDDDWSAPNRLGAQVACLNDRGAAVCGMRALYFYDPSNRRAWRYVYPSGRRLWVAGTSLCYTKAAWARSPFAPVSVGEDSRFVFAQAPQTVAEVITENWVIGILHQGNTAPKNIHDHWWARVPARDVEELIRPDLEFYHCFSEVAPRMHVSANGCDRTGLIRLPK